jgi:hypothetical protein
MMRVASVSPTHKVESLLTHCLIRGKTKMCLRGLRRRISAIYTIYPQTVLKECVEMHKDSIYVRCIHVQLQHGQEYKA